jgi:hypothetical protein
MKKSHAGLLPFPGKAADYLGRKKRWGSKKELV